MKKYLFSIILLIYPLISTIGQTEGYLDTIDYEIIFEYRQQALQENFPIQITDTMVLEIGKNWSVYYDYNKNKRDSIAKNRLIKSKFKRYAFSDDFEALHKRIEAGQEIYNVLDESLGESALIYKNKSINKIVTIDKGPLIGVDTPTNFILTEYIPPHKWIVSDDTLYILNYRCNKATTKFRGRSYTAWFSLDIPLNEGPWKLYGLPGLILQVSDEENLFNFTAIGIRKVSRQNIQFPVDKKLIECSSIKKLKSFRKNRFNKIYVGISENNTLLRFKINNPIKYVEIETEE